MNVKNLRALAHDMPYRGSAKKDDIEAWLLRYHPERLPAPADGLTVDSLFEGRLVETPAREVLKVSTIYSPTRVAAEVVYPVPLRTLVRECTDAHVSTWRPISDKLLARYETAWGRVSA